MVSEIRQRRDQLGRISAPLAQLRWQSDCHHNGSHGTPNGRQSETQVLSPLRSCGGRWGVVTGPRIVSHIDNVMVAHAARPVGSRSMFPIAAAVPKCRARGRVRSRRCISNETAAVDANSTCSLAFSWGIRRHAGFLRIERPLPRLLSRSARRVHRSCRSCIHAARRVAARHNQATATQTVLTCWDGAGSITVQHSPGRFRSSWCWHEIYSS
jgi:hypothetical protein